MQFSFNSRAIPRALARSILINSCQNQSAQQLSELFKLATQGDELAIRFLAAYNIGVHP